jgi:hypothetical protein
MTARQIQLLKLGFKPNEHQDCYILSKYDSTWYVDFNKVTDYDDSKWNIFMDDLIYDLEHTRIGFIGDLTNSEGYNFAKKEIRQKLLCELNKYRSWLQEETQPKMGRRTSNVEKVIELKAKVELLKELMK